MTTRNLDAAMRPNSIAIVGASERAGSVGSVVLANIQADVLVRFIRELCAAVAPGGQLVLSGILGSELGYVREQFSAANPGWRVESRVMGEWSDLALTRPV